MVARPPDRDGDTKSSLVDSYVVTQHREAPVTILPNDISCVAFSNEMDDSKRLV